MGQQFSREEIENYAKKVTRFFLQKEKRDRLSHTENKRKVLYRGIKILMKKDPERKRRIVEDQLYGKANILDASEETETFPQA